MNTLRVISIRTGFTGRQRGLATLGISMLVLFVTTLIVFAVGRNALFEQQLAGNDVRTREAKAAAAKGLDYGVNWLKTNWPVNWSGGTYPNVYTNVVGWTSSPDALANTASGSDSYTHTVTYTHLTDWGEYPPILQVRSVATATGDTQTTATVTTYIMRTSILGGGLVGGPPLIVEECITAGAITGTPDIWPLESGEAIGTMNLGGGGTACVNTGGFDMHGGSVAEADATEPSAIESFFGVTDDSQLRAYAELAPETFIYVDSDYPSNGFYDYNGSNWHENVGTQFEPVVLFFSDSAGCPTINGGTEIYGIVFYDTSNCATPGGGGGEIYGSMIFTGDLTKFNANTQLDKLDITNTLGGGTSVIAEVTQIPGTWRDF